MYETAHEIEALDELLTRSLRGASEHLRAIVTDRERTLDATETATVLTGMRTLSVAHIVGDDLGIFCHGRAEFLSPDHPDFPAIEEHLVAHYGSSPGSWAEDIAYLRVQPHWMVS